MHTDQARFTFSCSHDAAGQLALGQVADDGLLGFGRRRRRKSVARSGLGATSSRPASTSRQVSRSSGMSAYW